MEAYLRNKLGDVEPWAALKLSYLWSVCRIPVAWKPQGNYLVPPSGSRELAILSHSIYPCVRTPTLPSMEGQMVRAGVIMVLGTLYLLLLLE